MPPDPERFFGAESLWRDVRSGRAGFGVRMILSAAALGLCLAILFVILGLLENNRVSIRDEEAFAGLAAAAAAWMVCLHTIWSTFPRWRRALRTGFVCIGIIVGTIGLSIVFGTALRRPEFFIAGTIVGGISSVLAVVGATAYQSSKGRKILDAAGTVHVACPNCGYSMSGLDTCSCPECGSRYALDALIRLQGYEALSQSALKAPDRVVTHEAATQVQPQPLLGSAAT
jgi:hypothetical protein